MGNRPTVPSLGWIPSTLVADLKRLAGEALNMRIEMKSKGIYICGESRCKQAFRLGLLKEHEIRTRARTDPRHEFQLFHSDCGRKIEPFLQTLAARNGGTASLALYQVKDGHATVTYAECTDDKTYVERIYGFRYE